MFLLNYPPLTVVCFRIKGQGPCKIHSLKSKNMKTPLRLRLLLLAAIFSWVINPLFSMASVPDPCDPPPAVSGASLIYAKPPDLQEWYTVFGDLTAGYTMCLNPWQEFYYITVDELNSTVPLMQDHLNPFFLTGTYPASFYDYWSAKGVDATATDPSTWQYWMYQIIQGLQPMFYISYFEGYLKTVDGLQYLASGGLVQNYLRLSGDYPAGTYTFTGQIMDSAGCMTANVVVDMTTTNMILESVSIKAATNPLGPWAPVSGNLTDGYSMSLDPSVPFYYLDIDQLAISTPAAVNGFGAFLLTGTYPPSFFDYWNQKGVNASAVEPHWEYYMWRIINGIDPMFYILNTGSRYTLIDGLQHHVSSGTLLNPLRVSGDYPPDTYTFTGELFSEMNCTTPPQVVSITFLSPPECSISGEDEACSSEHVTFSAPPGMEGYAWTISGNGIITSRANLQTVHVKAGVSGSFTLSLSIFNENICSSTCQKTVTVIPKPSNISKITGPKSVCANETGVNYSVSMHNANEFEWNISSGGTIVGQVDDLGVDPAVSTVTVDFHNARANVTLSVTGINHHLVLCEGKKQEQHVRINPVPDQPVISVNGKVLTSNAANGNQWYVNSSSPTGPWTLIPGANKKKYTAKVSGWYTVDVTNNFGCISEKADAVFVNVTKELLSENEPGAGTIVTVYPNPGDGHFTIALNSVSDQEFHVLVYNTMGIIVMETMIPATEGLQKLNFDLSAQSNGLYLIILRNEEEQIIKRVILRK